MNPDNIVVARLPFPPGDRYKAAVEVQQFFEELLPRLERLPGVIAAAETTTLPPYGGVGTEIEIPGRTHAEKWNGQVQLVSEGYAQTLGLRLLRGRMLTKTEVSGARRVAVVNQTLVTRYFGGEDPIGRRIQCGLDSFEFMTIVGVVADVRTQGPTSPGQPEIYMPYQQHPGPATSLNLVVRTDATSASAYTATCTHQQCTITGITGSLFQCPCHGSQYNTSNGAVVRGPATQNLRRFNATVSGDVISITA